MRKNLLAAIVLLVLYIPSVWAAAGYPVRGRVIDRLSREPVAYAAVTITGQPGKGAMTDSLGRFEILQVKPGIYSLTASFIGYRTVVTPEYQVSARTPFIEIEMEEEPEHLNEVVVRPSPFRRTIESPVSMQVIGMREIEKSPGSNRDVSRIVRSYPGVSFSPIGYRNDLIVRDGDLERQTFKATLGASEVSLSGSGHVGKKTTYLFSVRQSYLQFLFKLLGLPFLPNYIDGQLKVKTRFSERDELTFLGLVGIDNMKLNLDEKGEENEYLLSYLPRIQQETFTVGAVYRHYAGRHVQSVALSHNYLNNRNTKYRNNDESTPDNLTLRLRGVEQKTTLRFENRSYLGRWTLREGAELNYSTYHNKTLQRTYQQEAELLDYRTYLGIVGWGFFVGADYASADKRLTVSMGVRADGCDYSAEMERFWKQLSPRVSASYALSDSWSVSGSAGLFYQLPPYTALGYKDNTGELVNRGLEYMRVLQSAVGVNWRLRDRLVVSLEGFYKYYTNIPLSVADDVPLTCKGNDYGTSGDELLVSSAQGRAYGLELMVRWQLPDRFNLVGALTVFSSEYRSRHDAKYIPSAWDNRFVANISGTYDFSRGWSVGAKLSAIGGTPYTPYDVDKSSLVEAWNASGRPYYDYSKYNTGRLDAFAQLDVRVDKVFYFRKCMLGIYVDLQNVTFSKLRQPDVLMSTGVIENPSAPPSEQRYKMKYIRQASGTLVPTLGVTVEF